MASFAVSVASPWIGAWLGMGSNSLKVLYLAVVIWALSLVVGLGLAIAGSVRKDSRKRATGLGILLGTLVGAIVGFSLCAGAVGPTDTR